MEADLDISIGRDLVKSSKLTISNDNSVTESHNLQSQIK